MGHGAWGGKFETGNPPVGWESEGRLRISNFEFER